MSHPEPLATPDAPHSIASSGFAGLFNPVSIAEFSDTFFARTPLALAGAARHLTGLIDWALLDRLLAAPLADVVLVKENERWPGGEIPDPQTARQLFSDGYTILTRHLERHDEAIRDLSFEVQRIFAGPVDVHAYFTPNNASGFGWHYDAEEVFIVQISGTKDYSLRKNTVNPWPLIDRLPSDMRYERECMPMSACRLTPGDWLYIPGGFWHKATAREESISMSIGVVAPTALSLVEYLRHLLADDLRWRVRLPVVGVSGSPNQPTPADVVSSLIPDLGDDIRARLQAPGFVNGFIQWLR